MLLARHGIDFLDEFLLGHPIAVALADIAEHFFTVSIENHQRGIVHTLTMELIAVRYAKTLRQLRTWVAVDRWLFEPIQFGKILDPSTDVLLAVGLDEQVNHVRCCRSQLRILIRVFQTERAFGLQKEV